MTRQQHRCPHCGTENEPISDAWQNLAAPDDRTTDTGTQTFSRCRNCDRELDVAGSDQTPEHRKAESSRFVVKFLITAALLSGSIIGLNLVFDVLSLKEDFARIVYAILLIVVVSSGLAAGRTGQKLKYLSIWAGIFLVLLVGFAYRHDLNRVTAKVAAVLVPMKGYQQSPASISFPVADDGHYYIRARVNNVPITFMADTGASHIVITPRDARRLGLNPDTLDFDRFYETANGTVRGSSIRLAEFSVGGLHFEGIRASVNEADMQTSLLGMTFFKRLKGYEVRDDILTLYW